MTLRGHPRLLYLAILFFVCALVPIGLWRQPSVDAIDLGTAGLLLATLVSFGLDAYDAKRFPSALLIAGLSGLLMTVILQLGRADPNPGFPWPSLAPALVFFAVAIKGWDRLQASRSSTET